MSLYFQQLIKMKSVITVLSNSHRSNYLLSIEEKYEKDIK